MYKIYKGDFANALLSSQKINKLFLIYYIYFKKTEKNLKYL